MKNEENVDDYSFDSLLEYQTIVQTLFTSTEEAYEFFKNYAKRKGFGVRKDDVRRSAKDGVLYFRGFVCRREGFRDKKYCVGEKIREHALERCGCPAKFSVTLDRKKWNWYVSEFIDNHNDELADKEEVVFIRSHRNIDSIQKAEIVSLQVAGLRKSQIMDVMEYRVGGFTNVGFVSRDLYNFAAYHKKSLIEEGDAESVLKRMKERKENDVEFFFDYETDEEGNLSTLFWSDAQSRIDYECFGDVVVFDSTYRVNRYNMPFIPFVGVNHHRSTTIFGCGIVANESAESYKWLLSKLLTAMYQNRPKSIITDGCPSMTKAIREILPQTTHRICSWHIERNMPRHLHYSNLEGFRVMLYNSCDPKEFESMWENYVSSSDSLVNSDWLKMMYNAKERWAAAYLKDDLFLGIRSNQRSESLNARLHMHLNKSMHLVDLFDHYEHCLSRIRRNEVELDCKASQSTPVTKTEFVELERDAAQIYTPELFYSVREEFQRSRDYEIVETEKDGDRKWYGVALNGNTEKKVVVEVSGNEEVEDVKCTCMQLECDKIPCRHILRVLIEMKAEEIPRCCVWKRWTKKPKTCLPLQERGSLFDWSGQMKRKNELFELVGEIFNEAAKSEDDHFEMMELLHQVASQQKKKREAKKEDIDTNHDETTSQFFGVSDPKVMVGRGAPKKRPKAYCDKGGKRKCGNCRQVGHNKTTCPKL